MSSKPDSERQKLIQDKCQIILGNLLREEDNKYCVDCDAKGPRWASWNLGIFLCIRCAGIHRNLGVHISKVKSVNLDTWTPEQVAYLQQMGNSQARAIYEANLPENFRRPQTDSSLEAFIRAKYEQKKYLAKEWVPPPPPPPAFDIEEERRKEKEKKKIKSKTNAAIELSTVPRPHSAGPHSPAIQENSNSVQVPDSSDLLSLGDNSKTVPNDAMNVFLSAPTSTSNKSSPVSSESSVPASNAASEPNFFEQEASSEASKSNKMTKESILSLYGSSNVQMPAAQHIPPVYGVPGGVFIAPTGFTPVAMAGYPPVTAQTINQCTVSQQMANLQLSQPSWNIAAQATSVNTPGMGGIFGANPGATGVAWPPSNTQNPTFANNVWQ